MTTESLVSSAAQRRKVDMLRAQIVIVVAALTSVSALGVAALAPGILERSVAAERAKAKGVDAATTTDTALARQRSQDITREVAAAVEQADLAKARAQTAAAQGRAVLDKARSVIVERPDSVVRQRTSTGDIFQGEARSGVPEGYGLIRRASGGIGASFFIDGESQGVGAFCAQESCEGAAYFGDYRSGQPTGHGEGVAGGGVYRGEFKAGVPDGYGEYVYGDGAVYRGGFLAGARHGFGLLKTPDGRVQAGFWTNNSLTMAGAPPQ